MYGICIVPSYIKNIATGLIWALTTQSHNLRNFCSLLRLQTSLPCVVIQISQVERRPCITSKSGVR